MYGASESQVAAIPVGGAALGVSSAAFGWLSVWAAVLWVAVMLFAAAAAWTVFTVLVHRSRRTR